MPKFIDLTGKRFGRLIVLRYVDKDTQRNSRWLCMCDCNKEKVVRGNNLKSGVTKSCGCLSIEKTKQRSTKHGHYMSITYQSWECMNQRCNNLNYKQYKDYGGRGIKICARWKNFSNFLEDMGERPTNKYSLDRIDNDGNYCKENCRWATRTEQQRNRQDNRLISFDNKMLCPIEWSEKTGIAEKTIRWRLDNNWSIKKTLTTPARKYKKRNKK